MSNTSTRTLGRTGLEVTALGFGAMELRGPPNGPSISDDDAGRLLNAVLDEGINFIDTSIDYGRSEELIGKFIAHRRSEYVLASKCGCVPGAALGTEHVHTAANIRTGVEHSLRTMQTDHLDLVQFHRSLSRREFDADGALDEVIALRDEGKVRFIGVSAVLPTLNEQIEMGTFDAFQIPYSALQREHEDVITRASDAGMGIIIRGGVARGAPEDWAGRRYYMVSNETMRDYWEQAKLDELLDGMTRTAFMLRFTLSHPALDTTIVGTRSIEHLRDNLAAAAQGPLPHEVYTEATRRLTAVGARPV
ncbi:MAG: aldo/keto reductase [Actinobacteria bacterium]|jgi:aryl-alcohol dehydrogenase-like predicted oxidoreductase|nr:MAG: aldo/keto reductase [Actinomycetota bacterium]